MLGQIESHAGIPYEVATVETRARYFGRITDYLVEVRALLNRHRPDVAQTWIEDRLDNPEQLVLPIHERYDFLTINVPSSFEQGAIPTKEEPPFGLLRIVACAKQAGFAAGILDAHTLNISLDEIATQLNNAQPRLVGLNPTSVNKPEAIAIAQICDSLSIPYIIGGIHATLDPEAAMADFPNAHAVVKGYGELAVIEILQRLNGESSDDPDLGIVYQGEHRNGYVPYARRVDINELPMIDQARLVQFPIVEQEVVVDGKNCQILEGSLYTTRGCPFACGFCASPMMVGRNEKNGLKPFDHPGMKRIGEEVQALVDLGATGIHFLDDMTLVHPKDVEALYQVFEERDLIGKIVWRGMTRAPIVARKDFNDDVLKKLKASGCWRITLGVESGNEETLKKINKKLNLDDVRTAVRKLVAANIEVKCFFIMGFPGETLEQMRETQQFILELKELGVTSISLFQFKPYPGTALWNEIVDTNPEALEKLEYVSPDARREVGGDRAVQGVYLPDDVVISAVPSGVVRQLVEETLNVFFS